MKVTRIATASLLGILSLGTGACSLSPARWRMAKYEIQAEVPESLTTGKPSAGPVAGHRSTRSAMGGNLEPRSSAAMPDGMLADNRTGALPPLPLEFGAGAEMVDIPKPDELTGIPRRTGSPELLMVPLRQEEGADPDLPNSGQPGDTGAPGLLPPMPDPEAPPILTDADVTPLEITPIAPAAEPESAGETAPAILPDETGDTAAPEPQPEPTPADPAPVAEHDAMESLLSALRPRRDAGSAPASTSGLASRGPLRAPRAP